MIYTPSTGSLTVIVNRQAFVRVHRDFDADMADDEGSQNDGQLVLRKMDFFHDSCNATFRRYRQLSHLWRSSAAWRFPFSGSRSQSAQQNLLAKDAVEPADDLQRLPSDRKILQQLQELTRLAREDNVAKIRDVLQLLRAADPSLMVPDGSRTFHPLHRDLIERIQAFPPALQKEILNDADATKPLLKTAYENEGPAAVVRFLHRHSGSEESLKAHLLLAAIHRDRGHRQAAMYWLSPVLESAAPTDLRQIAIAMQEELNARANNPKPDRIEQSVDVEQDAAPSDGISTDNEESASETFPLSHAWQQPLQLSSMQRRASSELVRLLAADLDQPSDCMDRRGTGCRCACCLRTIVRRIAGV